MNEQRQDVQFEPTYSSSVPIGYEALSISRKQWTIGRCGERGSGISVLIVRQDDIYIYIYKQQFYRFLMDVNKIVEYCIIVP